MKRILLATVAMTALASADAMAADMPPSYSPPPVIAAHPPMWTGCYIGGNIGVAFGNASVTDTTSGAEVSGNGSGFAGGGQIGCDYEFSNGFVIGMRNMFDGTINKKSGTFGTGPLAGDVANFNNQWFDTLTARLGYAMQPNWLLYFQGGGAWAQTSTNITAGGLQIGQTSSTRSGWTIGGGLEWMFAPYWSTFLEGNYMDFGSSSATVAGVPLTAKATESTVLVGVNYRF